MKRIPKSQRAAMGRRAKALRRSTGLTQVALSKLVGVHPRTVSRWDLGVSRMPTVVESYLRLVAEGAKTRRARRSAIIHKARKARRHPGA